MLKSRENLSFLLLLATVALSAPLVLGFLGALHPALDSFSHFRAHLSVVLAVLTLPLLFTKMRREAAMLLLFAIMALSTTVGAARDFLSGSTGAQAGEQGGARYSLVQINLREDNPEPKRILQMIARERPDVITYEEASEQWTKWLTVLQSSYPYHLNCADDPKTWGVGILSKRPFSESAQTACVGDGLLAIVPINFGGTTVHVAALHFSWPWPRWQPHQLRYIEPELRKLKGPLVVAGDFNAAPWSNAVRRVEHASGTRHMTGIGGTWMTYLLPVSLAPYIGLPIDQVLVSPEIGGAKVSTREDAGSDHLPVRLDFSVPPPVRPDEDKPETQSVMLQ